MKKGILLSLLLCGAIVAGSQSRLSLYEAFTGEQCSACAIANPGLQALIALNSRVLLLTYPSPFPAAGPVYNTYTPTSNARAAYYGITTAPQGRLDGTGLGSGTTSSIAGHVANLTQNDLNAAPQVSTPFTLNISHSWSVTGDSVIATITVKTPAGYTAPSGASLALRVALVENLHYGAAPGLNGEQDFPNVVREMFPTPAGTALPVNWTMGQTNTYTIVNRVARYVDKSNANLIAFIQNDASKYVMQAAPSTPLTIPLDAATIGVTPSARLRCVAGSTSVNASATLRNAGTTTLTSARIYYHTDASPFVQFVAWTGSLAPNGTTLVPLGTLSIPNGTHIITDSVVLPNGGIDINPGNGVGTGSVSVYSTTPANLPLVTGFESGTVPAGWILYDADSNGRNFGVAKNIFGPAAGFMGSTWYLVHNNYFVAKGETNYAILPAAKLGPGVTLAFAYAHAQYTSENDNLEVVYSTDCGANWTSLWNASGSSLSTAPPTTDYFVPTASQWATQSVDVSSVPAGALLAFRATSDYGNTLYIDNVRLEVPAGVESIGGLESLRLFPNPAAERTELSFTLKARADVRIAIQDATGREVVKVEDGRFEGGAHKLTIETHGLAAGMYYLNIQTEGGRVIKPLCVVR